MKSTKCRNCGEQVIWFKTSDGRNIPVESHSVEAGDEQFDSLTHINHLKMCKQPHFFKKPALILVPFLAGIVLSSPVSAEDIPELRAPVQPPTVIVETENRPKYFKDRHPVAYKRLRRARVLCIFVKPIIDIAGSTAQVCMLFFN